MKKIFLLLVLMLGSCNILPGNPGSLTAPEPGITEASEAGKCFYVWAAKDLPEIDDKFQNELKKVIPDAKGRAHTYGEDCVYPDGRTQFSAMETDFRLTVPVNDLKDDEALGQKIELTLPVIMQIPEESLPARIGWIEIQFTAKEEFRFVRFQHQAARQALEQGLRGAPLLRFLESAQ